MSRANCARCGAPAERDFLCGACAFDAGFPSAGDRAVRALFRRFGRRCDHEECRRRYREAGNRECLGTGVTIRGKA